MKITFAKKVVMCSIGIFILGWLITNIGVTILHPDPVKEKLENLHNQLIAIEIPINQKTKEFSLGLAALEILKNDLLILTDQRVQLQTEINQFTLYDTATQEIEDEDDLHLIPNANASVIENKGHQISTCYKNSVPKDDIQQKYVKMADKVSNHDLQFLALLDSENGLWTPDRRHSDGVGFGFCGMSLPWHKDDIEDPRFFTDPEWQIQVCYDHYKDGTTFYGKWKNHLKYFTCE